MADIQSLDSILKSRGTEVSAQWIASGSVPLTEFYKKTLKGDYSAIGVGLYGTGNGTIVIEDSIPSDFLIEDAFLYWVVGRGKDESLDTRGNLNGTPIKGQVITTIDYALQYFDFIRAAVTEAVKFGSNTLADFPYFTLGASLVVVYSNPSLSPKTVIINDGGMLFQQQWVSTTFENFNAGGLPLHARTTYLVGDGTEFLEDQAIFNNVVVAGPDAFRSMDGLYWDTLTTGVSSFVTSGDTIAEAAINSIDDILLWIAQVFSVTVKAEPLIPPRTRGVKL